MLKRGPFHYSVNALCFVELYGRHILSCEGNILKIFQCESGILVSVIHIFDVQPVSGLRCWNENEDAPAGSSAIVLLWGGDRYTILELSRKEGHDTACAHRVLLPESKTSGRILDSILRHTSNSTPTAWELIMITDNSKTMRLRGPAISNLVPSHICPSYQLSPGPPSTMLSASIAFKNDEELVLASGTTNGEVFVWTVIWKSLYEVDEISLPQILKLQNHTGAVFGLDISPPSKKAASTQRLLATCSDDRTIQIYDISGVFAPGMDWTIPEQCAGRVTGHASRIWSVKFLDSAISLFNLMSLGEDGTAQLWQGLLSHANDANNSPKSIEYNISHLSSFHYHSGKNLRSLAFHQHRETSYLVATGGADARVVNYVVEAGERMHTNTELSTRQGRNFLRIPDMNYVHSSSQPCRTPNEHLFETMVGQWRLSRVIRSSTSSYPSGTFEGVASLQERPSSDESFEREILYAEQGEFTSDIGFVLQARRKYIYRYSKTNDEISIWFVNPDNDIVDYLFHTLRFSDTARSQPLCAEQSSCSLTADGHHLCEQDMYEPTYSFHWDGKAEFSWSIKYTVKGPQKDYVSRASYVLDRSVIQAPKRTASPAERSHSDQKEKINDLITGMRCYAWLNNSMFVASTEHNNLLIGSVESTQSATEHGLSENDDLKWLELGSFQNIGPSSIITGSLSPSLVFLTSNQGSLHCLDPQSGNLLEISHGGRKICYVKCQSSLGDRTPEDGKGQTLTFIHFRRLGESDLSVIQLKRSSLPLNARDFEWIHHPDNAFAQPEFVTTSSFYLYSFGLLFEGSRHGDLRARNIETGNTKLFNNIHGQDAITAIVPLAFASSSNDEFHMLTVGRDGKVRYHELSLDDSGLVRLNTIHESSPPFERKIEGAQVNAKDHHIVLWGFNGTRFVVWDETARQELMSVRCGGSHRNWSYFHDGEGGGGSFVCTKASKCLVKYQSRPSHRIIQHGTHGREIKAMAILGSFETSSRGQESIIATGSEDTTIRLTRIDGRAFHSAAVLAKHTTGIQKLSWSRDGKYLFSCAGCEEMVAWRVRDLGDQLGVICEDVCPTVTADRSLRVMDIAVFDAVPSEPALEAATASMVAAVYSDSSVRIWRFSQQDSKFSLLALASYSTCCLTQIQHLCTQSSGFMLTTASDGSLACWEFDQGIMCELRLHSRHAIHQGYIHSLVVTEAWLEETDQGDNKARQGSQNEARSSLKGSKSKINHIVITGGDDQALGITHIKSTDPDEGGSLRASTQLITNAHASAVMDIVDLGKAADDTPRFATVGTDQKLKIWRLGRDGRGQISIMQETERTTGVADASSTAVYRGIDNDWQLVVAGMGIESWSWE